MMTDIVRDPYGNPLKRDATIDALRAENERLKIENIQMQAALGYGILAEDERHILPSNPFKCGTCDASKHLRAENERLGRDYQTARDAHDKLLAENERLRAALVAFADHFGPLEDNHMLHKEARRCFALARAALGDTHE